MTATVMSLQMLRRFIVRGSNFPHVCGIRGCATSVDNNSNSAEDVKTKLLEAALLHVPKLGWSEKSIIEGQPHLIDRPTTTTSPTAHQCI